MDRKERRKLLSLVNRVSLNQLEERRPEFAGWIADLEADGVDCSEYYDKIGTGTNRLIVPGIPKSHFIANFSSFTKTPENEAAYDVCFGYVSKFMQSYSKGLNITMLGTNGTGKTHLAAAICRYLSLGTAEIRQDVSLFKKLRAEELLWWDTFHQRRPFKYVNFNQWLTEIELLTTSGDFNKPLREAQELAKDDRLLILDEVFATKDTDYSARLFQVIVTHRHANHLPMVTITNRTAEELRGIDSTTADRLLDTSRSFVLETAGESYRAKGY